MFFKNSKVTIKKLFFIRQSYFFSRYELSRDENFHFKTKYYRQLSHIEV